MEELRSREIKYPQKSKEWLQSRKKLITASNVGMICPRSKEILLAHKPYSKIEYIEDLNEMCDSFGDLYSFFSKKINKGTPFIGSVATVWGEKFEDIAVDFYKKISNFPDIQDFSLVIDKEYDFLAASPDGVLIKENKLLEIKAPYSRKIIDGHVPLTYFLQMQIQMKVLEKGSCDYLECSFIEYKSILEFQEFTKDTDFRGILLVSYYNGSKEFPFLTFYKEAISFQVINNFLKEHSNKTEIPLNIVFFKLKTFNLVTVKYCQNLFNNVLLDILKTRNTQLKEIQLDPKLLKKYEKKLEFLEDSEEEN